MSKVNLLKNYLGWTKAPIVKLESGFRYYLKVFDYEIKRFLCWRLDLAIRYAPVCRIIKRYGYSGSSILEIGSGSVGLTSSLRKKVIGIDLNFDGIKLGYLQGCKASAEKLPFPSRSFDFVISMDMLEHIAPENREEVLYEILRCSRRYAVIGIPCSISSERADYLINKVYLKRTGREYSGFTEHMKNGLPNHKEITDMIINVLMRLNRSYRIKIENNFNLKTWYYYWYFHISRNQIIMLLKNKMLLPFYPIIKYLNFGNCYRKIWIVSIFD